MLIPHLTVGLSAFCCKQEPSLLPLSFLKTAVPIFYGFHLLWHLIILASEGTPRPNETNFSTVDEWNCVGKALGKGSEKGLSSLNRGAPAFLGLKTQWSEWSKVGGLTSIPLAQSTREAFFSSN